METTIYLGKKTALLLILCLFIFASSPAFGATVTGNLNVNANVAPMCRVVGVTDITFGINYDPTDAVANDTGAGDFTFRCTKNTAYGLYITGARTMTDGADTLNFELYEDAGRLTVYDNATPGNAGVAASNAPVVENIYGRIPALQDVGVGAYTGAVTITVEY